MRGLLTAAAALGARTRRIVAGRGRIVAEPLRPARDVARLEVLDQRSHVVAAAHHGCGWNPALLQGAGGIGVGCRCWTRLKASASPR